MRTNNVNQHITPGRGIEARPHWWEGSTLTAAPSLLLRVHPLLQGAKTILFRSNPAHLHLYVEFLPGFD